MNNHEKNFVKSLDAFIEAASNLANNWNHNSNVSENYPGYLPSFDEFYHDLLTWKEKITK